MNLDLKEKNGKLEVSIQLNKRVYSAQPKIRMNISDVRMLVEERYPKYLGKIRRSNSEESTGYVNSDDDNKLKGVFTFQLDTPVQKKKTTKTQTTQKK